MAFKAPVDILNRSNQHCGVSRVSTFTDTTSKAAMEGAFAYDKLRLAELSENLWKFATRTVILRALGIDSQVWTPSTWAAGTYSVGSVVAYTPASGPYINETIYYEANAAKTIANTTNPDSDTDWVRYSGPIVIDLYDTGVDGTGTTSYQAGEVVLVPAAYAGGTTYTTNDVVRSGTTWYVSLTTSNTGNAVTDTAHWAVWTNRGRGEGSFGLTACNSPIPLTFPTGYSVYLSLYNNNSDNPVSATGNWLSVGGTIASLVIKYPIGAGPSSDFATANVFRLPYGFLRRAPTDPKGGQFSYLGARSGTVPEDWVPEDQYLTSRGTGLTTHVIALRYVADVTDVSLMDVLFCEALAARLAVEVMEPVTQNDTKFAKADRAYRTSVARARATNMIEIGPISPVENRYVNVRA